MKAIHIIIMILCLILLSGCAPQEVTPEVETESDATTYHYWNNYDYLNGSKTFQVEASAGETLHVVFESVVNQGSVEVRVVSPKNKTLWETKVVASGTQESDVPVEVEGEYSVIVRAKATSGRYDVKVAVR